MDINHAVSAKDSKALAVDSFPTKEDFDVANSRADVDLNAFKDYLPQLITLAKAAVTIMEDSNWIAAKRGDSSEGLASGDAMETAAAAFLTGYTVAE